jgi:RNA polymerase sigma-70 factor (ECF subfamily)
MNERVLVERAKTGDRTAFGQIVLEYQARLRAMACRYHLENDDIHDIVQDSFLDAFRHLDRFDETRPLGPWLRAICRNRIRNFFRDRKVHREVPLMLVDRAIEGALDGLSELESAERVTVLRDCIAKLPAEKRALIHERYFNNLPVKEISRTAEKTPNHVSMILTRVRETLMHCVEQSLQGVTHEA